MSKNSITPLPRRLAPCGAVGAHHACRAQPASAHARHRLRPSASTSTRHMRQLPAMESRSWIAKARESPPPPAHASLQQGGAGRHMERAPIDMQRHHGTGRAGGPSDGLGFWSCSWDSWGSGEGERGVRSVLSFASLLRRPSKRSAVPAAAGFQFGAKMANQPLYRPGRSIAQRADGVALPPACSPRASRRSMSSGCRLAPRRAA